jgi:hypothetical protein
MIIEGLLHDYLSFCIEYYQKIGQTVWVIEQGKRR